MKRPEAIAASGDERLVPRPFASILVDVEQAAGQTVYVIQPANPQVVYVLGERWFVWIAMDRQIADLPNRKLQTLQRSALADSRSGCSTS
jgi:hypothetical protein